MIKLISAIKENNTTMTLKFLIILYNAFIRCFVSQDPWNQKLLREKPKCIAKKRVKQMWAKTSLIIETSEMITKLTFSLASSSSFLLLDKRTRIRLGVFRTPWDHTNWFKAVSTRTSLLNLRTKLQQVETSRKFIFHLT